MFLSVKLSLLFSSVKEIKTDIEKYLIIFKTISDFIE